ncbi:hypothetical protein CcCBS67573_g07721 [Chytriomyces confervae]|uniref:AAA+ ATPase domain-containing protein n=1 Tax=Chytriomyces confervae TaxID=246404 RepID=A0A507ESE0_9FUNG|nr:hypothetical protein CcCBS67573_g07721 [Chytriomyces confervae]
MGCTSRAPAAAPVHLTSQSRNILKLKIKRPDGAPSLLTSGQIYQDERSIGITMPIDKLVRVRGHDTVVLVGPSGCGKTRTCYDFARRRWCLYFDCARDLDFQAMIKMLEAIVPISKCTNSQKDFERASDKLFECLIAARMLVLQMWRKENRDSVKWFCSQRSDRTQQLLRDVFIEISHYSWLMMSEMFDKLERQTNCWLIFDESQCLLDTLASDYRPWRCDKHDISRDKLEHPRSFYSFATAFITHRRVKSAWCGTNVGIAYIEAPPFSAGPELPRYYTFTDFNFLTASQIFKLCKLWL